MDKNLLNAIYNFFKFFLITFIFILLFLVDVSFVQEGLFYYFKNVSLSLLFFIFFIVKKEYYQYAFATLFGIFVDWTNFGFLGFSSFLFLVLTMFYSFLNKYLPDNFFSNLLIDLIIYLSSAFVYSYYVFNSFVDLIFSGVIFCFIYNIIKYFSRML